MKVTYVLLRFPYLTETFITAEIHALQRLGVSVNIVSLLGSGAGPVQVASSALMPQVQYAPGFYSWRLWRNLLAELLRRPGATASVVWRWGMRLALRGGPRATIKRWGILLKAIAAVDAVRSQQPDRVHSHFAWLPGVGGAVISELLRRPFSVTVHAYDLFQKSEVHQDVCNRAEVVFAISEYNRSFLHRSAPSAQVKIVRCGVDLEEIAEPRTMLEGRADNDDILTVVSVGSLVEKKGHADLVAAVRQVLQAGTRLRLRIIGEGPWRGSLERDIRNSGLQEEVALLGAQTHDVILRELHSADVFALACVIAANGDRDGIPVALMEAAALGLPLVSTNVSGIPELVKTGETGIVCTAGAIDEIANALRQMAESPALRSSLGRGARDLVEREFQVDMNAERILSTWSASS